MGNIVSIELNGSVKLSEGADLKVLENIFEEAQGYWEFDSQNRLLSYGFWAEGSYTPDGPDHDKMLDRLVSEGYNLTAWREEVMHNSENGRMHYREQLRGTEEQKRSLRMQEISSEIAALQAERIELLGGEEETLGWLAGELSVRTYYALTDYGLETIADVQKLGSEEALLAIPNFGIKALKELKDVLSQRGRWF